MAISNAQFAEWLARDTERVVLCELKFAYESGGNVAEGTIYLSSRAYRTEAADTPASVSYHAAIRGAPVAALSIPVDGVFGRTEISVGRMTLDNAGGELDFLFDVIVDGRDAVFYIGDPSWERADFREALDVVSENVEISGDSEISVTMRDHRLLLDKEVAGAVVSDERRKPVVVGYGYNIEPILTDAASLTYCAIDNYSGSAVSAVRDRGVSLNDGLIWTATAATPISANTGTETITLAAHGLVENDVVNFPGGVNDVFAGMTPYTQYWVIAAGLTVNDFRLSLTKGGAAIDITFGVLAGSMQCYRARYYDNGVVDGTFSLSSPPDGALTCDVIGVSPGSYAVVGGGKAAVDMMNAYGDLPAARIDDASFIALTPGAGDGIQQWSLVIPDRQNLIEVLDSVSGVWPYFYGPNYIGVVRAFRMSLADLPSATSVASYDEDDVYGDISIERQRVERSRIRLLVKPNSRVQPFGEMSVDVLVADRSKWSAKYQQLHESTAYSGTAYSTNWPLFHKNATEVEIGIPASPHQTSYGDDIAEDIAAQFEPHRVLITFTTDLSAYSIDLGDVVTFSYPRYGLDAGVKCYVVRIETDFIKEEVRLTLLTRITPDYTTASHP